MDIRLVGKEIYTVTIFLPDQSFVLAGLREAIHSRDRKARLLQLQYDFDDIEVRAPRMELCADIIERVECLRRYVVLDGREARITYEELLHGLGELAQRASPPIDLENAYQRIRFV